MLRLPFHRSSMADTLLRCRCLSSASNSKPKKAGIRRFLPPYSQGVNTVLTSFVVFMLSAQVFQERKINKRLIAKYEGNGGERSSGSDIDAPNKLGGGVTTLRFLTADIDQISSVFSARISNIVMEEMVGGWLSSGSGWGVSKDKEEGKVERVENRVNSLIKRILKEGFEEVLGKVEDGVDDGKEKKKVGQSDPSDNGDAKGAGGTSFM